jgi:hypothetical protein
MALQQHLNNSFKIEYITAGNLYALCITFSSIKEDTRSRERENRLKIAFLKKYFFAYYTNHTLCICYLNILNFFKFQKNENL